MGILSFIKFLSCCLFLGQIPGQEVTEGTIVELHNPAPPFNENDPPPIWVQLEGPYVDLDMRSPFGAVFAAPYVAEDTRLVFRLTGLNDDQSGVPRDVAINVIDTGPVVRKLNIDGRSALDPELHPQSAEIVLQSAGHLHEISYSPKSGELGSQISELESIARVASLTDARNGPEYGVNTNGSAIYFNATSDNGTLQFFEARRFGGAYEVRQLSSGEFDRINQLPSQNPTALTTHLAYATRETDSPFGGGWISYADTTAPNADIRVTPVRPGYAGFRWIRGTSKFLTTLASGPDAGQVLLVDAETGDQRVITDDDGVKFDPYGWYAPEFGGNLALHATTDLSNLRIYRDSGAEFFEPVAELDPPVREGPRYVQSAEPFVASDGRSFISLTLKDNPGSVFSDVTNSQIWLYGIEDGPQRFTLRCDNGAANVVRHEAEVVSGTDQILVYYNVLQPTGLIDLMLCASGLPP
ncbi:MAG: hypothetical protein AAGC91_03605 [Pseudomonadota bacterium]